MTEDSGRGTGSPENPKVELTPYTGDGQVVRIGDGALSVVANPYKLDGRSSSHPLNVRGWTTMNTFVLVEGDHAMVYSTGYTIHKQALLAQLRRIVGRRQVSIAVPRPEWASMCNARAIADAFHANADGPFVVHQRMIMPPRLLLDFDADYSEPSPGLAKSELYMLSSTARTPVAPGSERGLDFFVPELRLLPANWAYDTGTRTLFTGDAFCWVWHDREEGPWMVDDAASDPTTLERVAHSLSGGRYWWLQGAVTDSIRRAVSEMFEKHDIRVIAPDHGAVIAGAGVRRHVQFLLDYLEMAARQPSIGVEAGSWTTDSMRQRA